MTKEQTNQDDNFMDADPKTLELNKDAPRPWVGKLHHSRGLSDDWGFIRDESGKLIIMVPVTVTHKEWAGHRRNNTDPTQPIVDAILDAINRPNTQDHPPSEAINEFLADQSARYSDTNVPDAGNGEQMNAMNTTDQNRAVASDCGESALSSGQLTDFMTSSRYAQNVPVILRNPGGYNNYHGTIKRVFMWGNQEWADIDWDIPVPPCTSPMQTEHLILANTNDPRRESVASDS